MVEKEQRLAYFAVSRDSDGSLAGGMLLVNGLGRPVEFHCTAPVAVNRAQQILYGQTLESYLIADHICATLVQKLSKAPAYLLAEEIAVLGIRSQTAFPVVTISPGPLETRQETEDSSRDSSSSPALSASTAQRVVVGSQKFYIYTAASAATDAEQFRRLTDQPLEFDLLEPFERIHLALAEARKAA